MSTARHHAEWLSLVEVSGPFLTMPVLKRVFPQGLDAHDPDHARHLRMAYEEWEDNQEGHRPIRPSINAWINFVLTQTPRNCPTKCWPRVRRIRKRSQAIIPEHGETLRPDFVVAILTGRDDPGKARLLVQIYPPSQNLEQPVPGPNWKASPDTRMMELLHSTDVRLGLVTNGEHWMLVDAPAGETTGFASWYATLWLEEPITLRAFRSLLGVRAVLRRAGRRHAGGHADRECHEPAGSHRPAWLSGPPGRRGADPVARSGRPGSRPGTAGRRAEDSISTRRP